jgi:hypothetical protein
VYVADSYNHRLKEVDPASATIRTLAGSGAAGYRDGEGTAAQLSEPGGLALGPGGSILVADTNNSLLRKFDPSTQLLSTLALKDVPPPRRSPDGPPAGASNTAVVDPPPGAALVRAPGVVAAAKGELQLIIQLPEEYHLTPGANSRFEAAVLGGTGGVQLQPSAGLLAEDNTGTVTAAVRFIRTLGSNGLVRVLAKVFFCKDQSVCLFEEVCFDLQLTEVGSDAAPVVVSLTHTLSAQAPVVTIPNL